MRSGLARLSRGVRSCSQRSLLRSLLVIVLAGSLASCSLFKNRSQRDAEDAQKDAVSEESAEKKVEQAPVRVVGEIVSVHAEEGFVLIRRYSQSGGFGKGNLIASLSPGGATSSLAITGERLGRFHAADIEEGTPSKGDVVVSRRLPESSKTPSTPVPQPQLSGFGAPGIKNFPGPGL